MLRLPIAHPDALRCLRLPVPSATDFSLPSAIHGTPTGQGLLLNAPLSPMRLFSNGDGRASQVPGGPLRTCPALRPRRDLHARPYGVSVRPSAFRTASAPAIRFFRGSMTRPAHPLSTLRRMDHSTTTQDSLPAAASFAGQDASSCRVPTKGFNHVSQHRIPLSQAFLDASRVAQGGFPPRAPTDPDVRN